MTFDALATFATAMFTILNPIGNTALFAGMVTVQEERRAIAVKCAMAVGVILVVSIWLGEWILNFFGVSIASLEVAGGLIIALIGMSMLHSRQSGIHSSGEQHGDSAAKQSIAIVPLAMPIVAGPGAIATVILYTHKHHGIQSNLEMSLVCLGMSVVVGVCFMSVGPITRLLGAAGINVVTKFMGLILLAVAIGMLATGAKELLPGLAGEAVSALKESGPAT
jgi:multiple antibiotic resistance protein